MYWRKWCQKVDFVRVCIIVTLQMNSVTVTQVLINTVLMTVSIIKYGNQSQNYFDADIGAGR